MTRKHSVHWQRVPLAPLVLVLAGSLAGCSDFEEPSQQDYEQQGTGGTVISGCNPKCRSGFTCVKGQCVSECNPECPAGSLCIDGSCELECNPPCSPGYTCVARVCTGNEDVAIYDYEEGKKPAEYGTFGTTWPNMGLTYSIANTPAGMAQEDVIAAIESATSKWHAVCEGLTFTPISGNNVDIQFKFAAMAHGDGVPFDGKGHVLAHAFYPGDGLGGDVHFDSDESWTAFSSGDKTILSAVALHELGHSLGLTHSNEIDSIMYPYYRAQVTDLQPDDIAGITHLYNCTSTNPGGCGNNACETNLGENCSSCPADCGCSGSTKCDNGTCVQACANECASGQTQCSGNSVQSCADVNGCFKWTTTQTCSSGDVCENGDCVPGCSNACSPGETQCSGNSVQSCSYSNGCYTWTTTQTCPSGQVCQNGGCTANCSNTCSPGQTQCSGNSVQSCIYLNGCYTWETTQTCPSGQVCQNGSCITNCSNTCSAGQTQCSGNNVQSCSYVNGCYGWTTTQTCGSTQVCQNGQCTSGCTATSYWNPASGSDLDVDGTQYNNGLIPLVGTGMRIEVSESGAGGLRLRACKVDSASPGLSTSVHVYMKSFEGFLMFDQGLAVDSSNTACTVWGELNNESNYPSGTTFNASWRVVSPANSAAYWSYSCTKGGSVDPTGSCFWDTHIQPMTRTCK